MTFLFHEKLFRGADAMTRLKDAKVGICGAGALGSHLALGLARTGVGHLRVIDRDRVEERNLSTQTWSRGDVGGPKAKLLAHTIFRAVGTQVDGRMKELTRSNGRALLRGLDLVIDVFDNSEARAAVQLAAAELRIPCLHAGLASDYAECVWDPHYTVPSNANDDVCDYPLARNLAVVAAALASELAVRFLATGEKRDLALTFGDLRIT